MQPTITRRHLLGTSLGLAAASVLTACGSGTPGEPAPTGSAPASTGATEAAAAVTIQFWHRTFTPVENDWYAGIIKQFNEAQNAVKVVGTEVPADAWDQKMKAAQAAGKAPDVYTHPGSIQDAVTAGQLHELDSVVPADALAEIIDAAKSVSEKDGKYYAYPLLLEPQGVLFWNKDMMEAAGLDPEKGPKTWDEMFGMCEKIKPTLQTGQYCISPAQDAVTFAWSSVGQQYNFAGHTALKDDWTAAAVEDPGYEALIAVYKKLWDNDYMPKQPLAAYVEGKDFGEKKVAFKISGSWMMSEIGSDYPDLLMKTGIGALPNSPDAGDRTATTLGNFKWVIDAKAKDPQAAGDFLSWAIAGDPALLVPFFVTTQFTKVPVRESVQKAVASDEKAANAPWVKVITDEIAPTAIPEPSYPWDVSVAVGTAIEAGMKGASPIDVALTTATKSIQTVVDREGLAAKAPK
ncbi:ABC transporter substrate-binding protein [Tessaracoccus sp.]